MKHYNVKCKRCGEVMRRPDWDVHDCMPDVKPREGESFESYSRRCDEAAQGRFPNQDN